VALGARRPPCCPNAPGGGLRADRSACPPLTAVGVGSREERWNAGTGGTSGAELRTVEWSCCEWRMGRGWRGWERWGGGEPVDKRRAPADTEDLRL